MGDPIRETRDATAITDVLELRSMPWLEHLQTSSLEALAEQLGHVHAGSGTVLQDEHQTMSRVFLVREGALRIRHAGAERLATAEQPVCLLSLLAGYDTAMEIVAETEVRSFAIQSDAVWEALEEDFAVLVHSVVQLARALVYVNYEGRATRREALRDYDELVPRIRWLRSTSAFEDAPVGAVGALAKRATVRELQSGQMLWHEGEPSTGMCFVLSGSFEEAGRRLRSGDLVGELTALCEAGRRRPCTAIERSRVLWLDIDTVWDVLEDHFQLARHTLCRLSRGVLDTIARPLHSS